MSGAARDMPWAAEGKPSCMPEWYSGYPSKWPEYHSDLQDGIVPLIVVGAILLFAHVRGAQDVTFGKPTNTLCYRILFDTRHET